MGSFLLFADFLAHCTPEIWLYLDIVSQVALCFSHQVSYINAPNQMQKFEPFN